MQPLAYSVTAVMDALWTPSCRSTTERRGFSSHPALIRHKLTKAHEAKKNARIAPSAGTAPTNMAPSCASATPPKTRLRLPRTGNEEVLQDGYRLVLLPKLAYYMWDGHGESFAVPRATSKVQRLRCPVAATPPHPMWALTLQAILQP